MENKRSATDIILGLEQQIKTLNSLLTSQDLALKLISNKLNEVIKSLQENHNSKITVEAINHNINAAQPIVIDPERQIPVSSEESLPEEKEPKGFRRTSRPETYAGDNSYLNKVPKKKDEPVNYPIQIPKPNGKAEVIVPDMATNLNKEQAPVKPTKQHVTSGNNIPTMQRIVDRNGKSIFMANVEVIDLSTVETVYKGRTNGTGKWQASLPVGEYKVIIKKIDPITKQVTEVSQNVRIDGTQSPLDLQMMIIK